MPRYFEQVVLVDEETHHVVIERNYPDGVIEYWSSLVIGFQNQLGQQGTTNVPFQIRIPDAFAIDRGQRMSDEEFNLAMREACRQAAFDGFDQAMADAEPGAHAYVKSEIEKQQRQQNSKILLANALPKLHAK